MFADDVDVSCDVEVIDSLASRHAARMVIKSRRDGPMVRGVVFGAALAMALTLSGCKKELYGNLGERDCNQMVAALLEAGIDAEKVSPDGGKTWSAKVEEGQMVKAMDVLRQDGLPANRYDDLGKLFKKDGLVSTPTEERVRFIYGVSQELSDTLSKIDGVVVARVHIVLPDNDPLANAVKPSSASVFIKYQPDANLATLTPQIKNLVVHSVEGLSYDQVSVTSVPADPMDVISATHAADTWSPMRIAVGVFLLAGIVLLLTMRRKPKDGMTPRVGKGQGNGTSSMPAGQRMSDAAAGGETGGGQASQPGGAAPRGVAGLVPKLDAGRLAAALPGNLFKRDDAADSR